jgi:hypothetical protein
VAEVARRANLTPDEVKAEAAVLGMFVGEGWDHQEALSTRDAYALVDGSGRRNLEHETAWRAHVEALERWQEERENVRRHAFDPEWKANVRRGFNNGPSSDAAHAAARETVAAYEKANPEPQFCEPESRVQGWIRRVTAVLGERSRIWR